jgi:hypothetical protein
MFSFTVLTHFRDVGQQKPNPLKVFGNEKEGGAVNKANVPNMSGTMAIEVSLKFKRSGFD